MNRLTFEELHWLMSFARNNDFFQSLLDFYHKRKGLSYKQFYYLEREIKKAKKKGKVVLSSEEYEFLKKYSEIYKILKKLLEMYTTTWCLDYNIHNHFIEVKHLINARNTLPDDIIIEEHLKLNNIPRRIEKIPTRKSNSNDIYEEKFKKLQEKGRKLRSLYQNEGIKPKEKPEANEPAIEFDTEDDSPPEDFHIKSHKKSEKSKVSQKPYKEIKESYIYKKRGESIKIFSKSTGALKVSIPLRTFENKKEGLYKCDCGMYFFSPRDLVKHIIQVSKCLDHYISFELEEPEKEQIDKKATIKKPMTINAPQKPKFININGQNLKLEECNFVIDGANVARECNHGSNGGSIANFRKLFEKLHIFQINNYITLCDRSLNYTIDDKKTYRELVDKGKIVETPGGTEADHFILKYAKKNDSFIISNDLFREFESIFGKHWIREKRISFKIINDTLYFDKIYTSV